MKTLPTQERLKELLDYDPTTGLFYWKKPTARCIKVGDAAGYQQKGYTIIKVDGKKFYAHRLAWRYVYGEDPLSLSIDHINRDRTDNRISNLRVCNQHQNQGNRLTKGVYSRGNRWDVVVGCNYIGSYKDKDAAIEIFQTEHAKHFKEYSPYYD